MQADGARRAFPRGWLSRIGYRQDCGARDASQPRYEQHDVSPFMPRLPIKIIVEVLSPHAPLWCTDEYLELKRLSERNRVSVAWLVRNAVTEHLQAQAPLFAKTRARS